MKFIVTVLTASYCYIVYVAIIVLLTLIEKNQSKMKTRKISIIDRENTYELPKYERCETMASILPGRLKGASISPQC